MKGNQAPSLGIGDRLIVYADAAGTCRIPVQAQLRPGIQFGITMQCGYKVGGGVQVLLTMDPEEDALKQALDANISWFAWKTFVVNEMATPGMLFSCAKLVFAGANSFTLMGQ